jgi:hypothetical protein
MTAPTGPQRLEILKELSEANLQPGEALQEATFIGWKAVEAALHEPRLKRLAQLRLLPPVKNPEIDSAKWL